MTCKTWKIADLIYILYNVFLYFFSLCNLSTSDSVISFFIFLYRDCSVTRQQKNTESKVKKLERLWSKYEVIIFRYAGTVYVSVNKGLYKVECCCFLNETILILFNCCLLETYAKAAKCAKNAEEASNVESHSESEGQGRKQTLYSLGK